MRNNNNNNNKSLLVTLLSLLLVAAFGVNGQSTSTCDFGDGTIYQINDIVPTFQTRCGPISDFPCYCAPDLPRQVYCPYCGHALEDDSLLCLTDGQSQTFVSIDGVNQTCTCAIEGGGDDGTGQFGEPVSTCIEELGNANPTQLEQAPGPNGQQTCTIELPDGSTQQFNAGDALGDDVLPNNRCGGADAFPCYCDPSAPGHIVCPYCRFPQSDGNLLCAVDGETVNFIDINDEPQECSCTIPTDDPAAEPITNCVAGSSSSNNNDEGERDSNNNNSDSDNQPNRPSSPPDNNNYNNSDPTDMCTLEVEATGEIMTFQRGESYGEYLQTRCGSTSDYPCYCNPDLPMQMDCPYCGFVTSAGELVCGRDGETVTFASEGGIGGEETCLCEIPDEPGAEPIRTCGNGVTAPPTPTPPLVEEADQCTLVDLTGTEVTFQNGDSLGDLVEGVCGDSSEWPAFCNTNLVTATVTTRQGGSQPQDISNGIDYPYCVYSDTLSGDPICAKNNNEITYTNSDGDEITCSCQYLSSPGIGGGAQSQCQPVNNSTPSSPTASPTPPLFQNPNSNINSGGTSNVVMLGGVSSYKSLMLLSLVTTTTTAAAALGLSVL